MTKGDLLYRVEKLSTPEPVSGCWLWLGMVDDEGYAMSKIHNKRKRTARHLHMYLTGDTPEVVGHTCNNKSCVNPNHLYSSTIKENSAHAKRDGLYRRGVNHPNALIWTREAVEDVLNLRDAGYTQQDIATEYGVHQSRISELLLGKAIIDDTR